MMKIVLIFCLLFMALNININSVLSDECKAPHVVDGQALQNPKSSMVFDGSKEVVTIELPNNSPKQLWTLESNPDGSFFIINKGTKKVLAPRSSTKSAEIVTVEKSDLKNQKWFIEKSGTILNADADLVLDISKAKFTAGQKIIIYTKSSRQHQIFKFLRRSTIVPPFDMYLFNVFNITS